MFNTHYTTTLQNSFSDVTATYICSFLQVTVTVH